MDCLCIKDNHLLNDTFPYNTALDRKAFPSSEKGDRRTAVDEMVAERSKPRYNLSSTNNRPLHTAEVYCYIAYSNSKAPV